MTFGLFEVLRGNYAGCNPGEEFEAPIRASHHRAIARGHIRLIREVIPTIVPGSYEFPAGWLQERGK